MVRLVLLLLFCLCSPALGLASEKVFTTPDSVDDYISVSNPTQTTEFFGTLAGNPEMYELTLEERTRLVVALRVPVEAESQPSISGLLVKEAERGVEEVKRLPGQSDYLKKSYDFWTGDSYLRGPSLALELEPGDYLFEVSSPDNEGRYVLTIGDDDTLQLNYWQALRHIYRVKLFLGKSSLAMVESPLVYIPVLVLLILISVYWRRRRYV